MRILLIHQYFLGPNDGGGSRFNEMTKQWSEMGHEITVLSGMMHAQAHEKIPEFKGKFIVKRKHDKVDVIRCHVSESYNNGFLGRLWGYFSFVFSSIWAGLFSTKGKFDVILVTSPPLFVGITAYILSVIKRTPFVFEVRDLWPESAIDTGVVTNKWIIKFAFWFEAFIYKKAKLVNVLTPAFRDVLVNKKGIPKNKVIFIPNAADFTLSNEVVNSGFDPKKFREDNGWQDKLVITYVGAHGVANHLIQIIETAELIKDKLPNVLFVLIGGGMQKEMLVDEAKKRNCDNVQFFGAVPKSEVFKYILASDFGASVLKKVDTFKTIYSNKTFDYMSCKKPIVLAIDGVSRELVESAKCGIYIEPEDINDWVSKIEYLTSLSSSEIETLGVNGYDYAKINFDRELLGKEYISLVEKKIRKSI